MPDGGECAFDRIGRPDVFQVFCRNVVEGQQRIPVLAQLGHCLVSFHPISFDEETEGGVDFGFRRGLPVVV